MPLPAANAERRFADWKRELEAKETEFRPERLGA
jgi:hypothetical protein